MKDINIKHYTFAALLSLSACAQTQNWDGVYTYDSVIGENVAKDSMVIEYTFKLDKDTCLITSQGYQTDETILCVATQSKNSLVVSFSAYGNGSTKNIYGVEVYPPQSTLFSLTKQHNSLSTTWGSLMPDEQLKAGEYFIKTKE